MRLLVCDDRKISYYLLPKKIENFFMINLQFVIDDIEYNEVLTLKSNDNNWNIVADDKLNIKKNGIECNTVSLKENLFLQLKFADMSTYLDIYVIANFVNYVPYSVGNIEKIDIGSAKDCQIYSPNLINLAVSLTRDGYDFFIKRVNSKSSSSYLNSQIYDSSKLNVGDIIFVSGIQIVYMKNFIMINDFMNTVQIKDLTTITSNNVISTKVTHVNDLEKNVKLFNESQLFVHTPRLKNEIEEEVIEFEEPPTKEEFQKTPIIFTFGTSAIMTLTSSVSLINSIRTYAKGQGDLFSLIMELIVFGLMMIVSLFIPMLMEKWEKRNIKKKESMRQEKYRSYIIERQELIKQCVLKQENVLKANNLSLNKIIENINNNCKDVWNREIFDSDFLSVTFGIGNRPAKMKIIAPKKQFSLQDDELKKLVLEVSRENNELKEVPITFSILENNIAPIVIDSKFADDYIKSIMLQLIYFYSGNDLKIVTITNEYNENKWDFMKYISHGWDKDYERRFFATNEDEIMQLSLFLEREYDNRVNFSSNNSKQKKYMNFSEYYLIVTDDFKLARELSVINKILESNENMGFSILIFENSIKNLPSRFNTLVQIVDTNGVIIERNISNSVQSSFSMSYLSNLDIDKYARIIANIPVNIKNASNDIPSSLNFLDMFYAGRVDQLNILSRWASNNPTISLKAPIGMKENNKLIELDLHEKYHGPHGLIAGMTGSGKSEFIITFILSMAINYHPYEVQFVLIDYKGGGLAGAFENRETGVKIPHLVGTITNLDISEMNRTLVSIKSELQRRQRVFNKAREQNNESTIDIYKYQRLYRDGKVSEPMSHLFIISDEFAELKMQQPDFMEELVSAARIGRSLGVHLILATQKPSGVVDDQIWSNTRFRVCLKVQSPEDSNELLKRDDAAYIKEAGRFYLQVGNDEMFELGQSGWAGAKYIPSDNVQVKLDDSISFITNSGEVLKVVNEEIKKEEQNEDKGDQLTNIVKRLYDVAKSENINFSSLWLENIPEKIFYNNIIKKYQLKAKPFYINPIIGEFDDPSNQRQGYVDLPFLSSGNTFIVGANGSGKNTLLSTIIYSLIINHNVDEVNIYIIDMGSEKLKIFKKAPQVGEVLTSLDADKIKFLFYMLLDERDKRFKYYSENGGDFAKDVERGSSPFPNIVLIINQFEVFRENFEDFVDEDFGPFSRNCSKVGIYLIVTSTLTNTLGYNIENNFPKKIMLNMVDSSDYRIFFDNSPIPKKNAGRGLIEIFDVLEFQVPLIFEDDVYEQNLSYTIEQLCNHLKKKARRVPTVPNDVTYKLLQPYITNLESVPMGINIQTAQLNNFNFNNLLNVITGESNIAAKYFFPKLVQIFNSLENTKVIVINSFKNLNFEGFGEAKYYNSNFQAVLNVINNNVNRYIKEGSNNNFVIIFIGYKKLQDYLTSQKEDNPEIVTIDDLISNSKLVNNFRYILYDKESEINSIGDGSLDTLFKRNNGIWLGKNFDSQDVFEVINRYNNISLGNSNIVLLKNGNTDYVKYM